MMRKQDKKRKKNSRKKKTFCNLFKIFFVKNYFSFFLFSMILDPSSPLFDHSPCPRRRGLEGGAGEADGSGL
jgi:hypothetical protein